MGMTRPLAILAMVLMIPVDHAAGQSGGSLGAGVGTVRYAGGTSFSSASLSPVAAYDSPTLTANANGVLASLPGGVWSTQGRGEFWGATPPLADHWRFALQTTAAGTIRTDGGWSAAANVVGEMLWAAPKWGVGLGAGPSAGWISDTSSVAALHLRARAWGRAGLANWVVSVEPTRFPDGWFTDVGAGVTLDRGRVVGALWVARRVSGVYGSTTAASATVQVFVTPFIALELGGGSSLAEPYQGLPRAGYFTAGVRMHPRRRSVSTVVATQSAPLVPARVGDSLVVRFQLGGAATVAIAGDWNAWKPAPLRALGTGRWEGVLALPLGLYHFNLVVDGGEWVVPNGVTTVNDGFGGMVGVLVVR
jgi:hypothetical protein